jgi:hypothetical protein
MIIKFFKYAFHNNFAFVGFYWLGRDCKFTTLRNGNQVGTDNCVKKRVHVDELMYGVDISPDRCNRNFGCLQT